MKQIIYRLYNMFKNKVDTFQEGGLHIDEKHWTLDKPMVPCRLAIWALVLDGNLVNFFNIQCQLQY